MGLLYIIIFCIFAASLGGFFWIYFHRTSIVRIKKDQVFEFKSSFDLTGLPIITFYQGNTKHNFLIDSGSNMTYINKDSFIDVQMTNDKDVFMDVSGTDISCQYANVKLYRKDAEYETKAAVADLSTAFAELKSIYGVSLTGIIGCDFMNKYSYCIDFKELVVYVRK